MEKSKTKYASKINEIAVNTNKFTNKTKPCTKMRSQ